ncbi:hypothetical protein Efla_007343 [Eimeria flavescens]
MLQQFYELLCCWCCEGAPLNEEALRCHYSRVFVLLDLAVDFGLPFISEENVLQLLLPPSGVVAKALQLVQGSSRVLTSLAASIGFKGQQQQQQQQQQQGQQQQGLLSVAPQLTAGSGLGTGSGQGEGCGLSGSGSDHWWRRGGVHYASNEVYVDLVEKLTGIVDRQVPFSAAPNAILAAAAAAACAGAAVAAAAVVVFIAATAAAAARGAAAVGGAPAHAVVAAAAVAAAVACVGVCLLLLCIAAAAAKC